MHEPPPLPFSLTLFSFTPNCDFIHAVLHCLFLLIPLYLIQVLQGKNFANNVKGRKPDCNGKIGSWTLIKSHVYAFS